MVSGAKAPGSAGLTLGMVRAVSEALRTRSMTEAALILGVSQSAITQQVGKFEAVTGVKVMSRVGNTLFVEREDIAYVLEMITELSQQLDRLVNTKAPKAALALPFCVSALIGSHPDLARWTSEHFYSEVMGFKDLVKQSGQNNFDLVVRPLRARETEVDYQFDCFFRMLKPKTWLAASEEPQRMPVLMPGGECPSHFAAAEFLQSNGIAYAEAGRSEEISYRAMQLTLGLSATLLPTGLVDHATQYGQFTDCHPIGEPFPVRIGVQSIRRNGGNSHAAFLFDAIGSRLKDHGVSVGN
jgi:DNA-binding transcriptional LysR family regulator